MICRSCGTTSRLTGTGVAVYTEPCGHGWESAEVRILRDGRIVAATGSSAQGQGRVTSYRQIVADVLRQKRGEPF